MQCLSCREWSSNRFPAKRLNYSIKSMDYVKFKMTSPDSSGSEHNFVVAWFSSELITFLNCDPTLIYLLRRVGAKAQKRVGAGDLLETRGVSVTSYRIYCLSSYEKNSDHNHSKCYTSVGTCCTKSMLSCKNRRI
jgi:hypothetical protein